MGRRVNNQPTEIEKVYLYKLSQYGVDKYYGDLKRYGFARRYFTCERVIAQEVARNPGEVYRRTIWFREPNFDKAKELFTQYELDLIKQSERKIVSSKQMLEVINKSTSK